jgi:integrase
VNVNKTVEALARIIEWAKMEGLYEDENPAASKAQREKVKKRARVGTWLDYDLLMCALDAAADLDANSPRSDYRNLGRTIVFALLFIGGLRVTEACLLRWRHVDSPAASSASSTRRAARCARSSSSPGCATSCSNTRRGRAGRAATTT